MDTKIIKFLPYSIRTQIENEYVNTIRNFRYLLETHPDRYQWIDDPEYIEFLLLIGIFHRRLIEPLKGTVIFSRLVNKYKAESIRIGSIDLTASSIDQIEFFVSKFEGILKKYNLSPDFFNYNRLSDFLELLQKEKENGSKL